MVFTRVSRIIRGFFGFASLDYMFGLEDNTLGDMLRGHVARTCCEDMLGGTVEGTSSFQLRVYAFWRQNASW